MPRDIWFSWTLFQQIRSDNSHLAYYKLQLKTNLTAHTRTFTTYQLMSKRLIENVAIYNIKRSIICEMA